MELEWTTPQDMGKLWGIKVRRVQALCESGKIDGATKLGRVWLIPKNAPKPLDGRTKAARNDGRKFEHGGNDNGKERS